MYAILCVVIGVATARRLSLLCYVAAHRAAGLALCYWLAAARPVLCYWLAAAGQCRLYCLACQLYHFAARCLVGGRWYLWVDCQLYMPRTWQHPCPRQHGKRSVDCHRHQRQVELQCQLISTLLEWPHLAGERACPLWKHHQRHAVAQPLLGG